MEKCRVRRDEVCVILGIDGVTRQVREAAGKRNSAPSIREVIDSM